MKKLKIMTISVICASLILASACGSTKSSYATDKAVSVAQQAIDTIDSYLDGKMGGDLARSKLDELTDEMDYVDDLPRDTAEEDRQYAADWSIDLALTTAQLSILDDQYDGDNETYDDVVNARNSIAETAGLETR